MVLRSGGAQQHAISRLQNVLELSRTELENVPFPHRLLTRERQWRALTTERSVLRLVMKGIRLPLIAPVPLRRQLHATVPVHMLPVYEAHIAGQLASGVIQETHERAVHLASLFFHVPKRSGGWRFVHDLRLLNAHLDTPTFRMDSLAVIRAALPRGAWFTSVDLRDAYWHIPVPQWLRRFLAFQALGRTFQWASMPMGLASSARYFTLALKPALALLRQCGVMVFAYLDDILIAGPTMADANFGCQMTLGLLEALGFAINYKKSILTPTQRIRHLGFTLDSVHNRIYLPQDRRQELQRQARKTLKLSASGTLTCRLLASLIGKASAALEAMPNARLHMHALHRALRWNLARSASGDDWSATALLSLAAKRAAEWWASLAVTRVNGAPLVTPKAAVTLTTDASESGWGATITINSRERPSALPLQLTTHGFWSPQEAAQSSNWREATALQLGFFAMRLHRLPRHTTIAIRTDNMTALSYIRRAGGRHCHLAQQLEPVARCALRRRLHLRPTHIAGLKNTLADELSRRPPDRHDWSIDWPTAQLVLRAAQPTLDAFASRLNHIVDRYCSALPDPKALAVDGLSVSWRDERVYAAPPVPLIPLVIAKALNERASVCLLTPNWPNQPWFGLLSATASRPPIDISARSIRPGPSGRAVLKSGRPTRFLLWQLGQPTPWWDLVC